MIAVVDLHGHFGLCLTIPTVRQRITRESPAGSRIIFRVKEAPHMASEKNETPFFARYLEGQQFPQVKTGIKSGLMTLKYPSDSDELAHTLKYPSDGDEV